MNTIIEVYNKITKKETKCNSCVNCHKTEEELAGEPDTLSLSKEPDEMRLSNEKLCLNCEIMLYPDRFHGCGFCKRPIREKFSCTICANGFNSWLRSEIYGSDTLSQMLRISADSLLCEQIHKNQSSIISSFFCDLICTSSKLIKFKSTKSEESKPSNSDLQHKFILRTSDSYYKWPGFYAGITDKFSQKSNFFPVWIIPRLDTRYCMKYTKLKPDVKMFQRMILEILEANNISLYEDIQIDLDVFDKNQIKEVNPYDTRIVKPMNPGS